MILIFFKKVISMCYQNKIWFLRLRCTMKCEHHRQKELSISHPIFSVHCHKPVRHRISPSKLVPFQRRKAPIVYTNFGWATGFEQYEECDLDRGSAKAEKRTRMDLVCEQSFWVASACEVLAVFNEVHRGHDAHTRASDGWHTWHVLFPKFATAARHHLN